jgi:RNA polymerase sigma-70 factor (ECF subfamily)
MYSPKGPRAGNILDPRGVYDDEAMGKGRLSGWATGEDRRGEFEEVALVHLGAIYRSALRLTHNRAEAEDLAQETCLRAFRSFHRFNPGTNCRAWLFTILRNAFRDRLRRGGRERLDAEAPDWDGESQSATAMAPVGHPEEEFFLTVLDGDVDRALKALPLAFREVVMLSDLEALSYKEIAEVVGCPIGTVMSRLSRGRALLRRALGRVAREHGYLKESQ